MKRILFIAFSLLMLASCGGGGGDDGGGTSPTPNPNPNPNPIPQTYTQTVNIGADGGVESLTLSNLSSAVSSIGHTPDWIVISPEHYTSGAPKLKLEIEENNVTEVRSCEVTILAASDDKVILTVTQEAGIPKNIDDTHDEESDLPAYAPQQ